MSKVYVIQTSGKDLTPAKEYGELNVMLVRDEIHADYEEVQKIFLTELAKFNVGEDYLLLIGDPIHIGLAMTSLFAYVGSANILRWNPKNYNYDVVSVTDITWSETEL